MAVIPAVPPMNSITRNGPPIKPVASQTENTKIFAKHDCDQKTGAERRPVVDHGRELIGTGEQRQRQCDADEPEGDSADHRSSTVYLASGARASS